MGRVVDLMREAGGMQIMQDLVGHGVAFDITEREIRSQEKVLNREEQDLILVLK